MLSEGVDSSLPGHLVLDGVNLIPVQETHFGRLYSGRHPTLSWDEEHSQVIVSTGFKYE